MFIDRKTELSALIRRFHSEKAELVILYGRRRVGKSELTDQFISQVGGIRLLAREESKHLQLKRISSELAGFFQDDYLLHAPFPDWDAFFVYLTKHGDKCVLIAIDELRTKSESGHSIIAGMRIEVSIKASMIHPV